MVGAGTGGLGDVNRENQEKLELEASRPEQAPDNMQSEQFSTNENSFVEGERTEPYVRKSKTLTQEEKDLDAAGNKSDPMSRAPAWMQNIWGVGGRDREKITKNE